MRTFTVHLVKRGERDNPWMVDQEAPDRYAAENFARANEALRLGIDVAAEAEQTNNQAAACTLTVGRGHATHFEETS